MRLVGVTIVMIIFCHRGDRVSLIEASRYKSSVFVVEMMVAYVIAQERGVWYLY